MDPASVFVLYLAGVLCAWLARTVVHPALSALSNVGVMLPVGRRFLALAISVILIAGVVRPGSAEGSVGPPSHRMVQMLEDASFVNTSGIVTVALRPMAIAGLTTHTVEPGDSLWKIARGLLSSDDSAPAGGAISDLWRSIYELNRDLIGDDPNLILPGQVFQLPGR